MTAIANELLVINAAARRIKEIVGSRMHSGIHLLLDRF